MDDASSTRNESASLLLSVKALNDVRDRLKGPPLTGRPVLIPCGPRAFLPAKLCPLTKPELSGGDDEASKDQEYVTVRSVQDGSTATTNQVMTRREALDALQTELEQQQQQQQQQPRKLPKKETKQSASIGETNTTTEPPTQRLPFMEIREEIDALGNETKAEALNVTQQLRMWQDHTKNDDSLPTGDALRTATRNDNYESLDKNNDADDIDNVQRLVSDEEYAKLVNRLDHLIRLEEEEAQKAPSIHPPTLAWSKGFLNATKPKKMKPPPAAAASLAFSSEEHHATNKKGVSFHTTTAVQEIPRIGKRSVRRETAAPRLDVAGASQEVMEKPSRFSSQNRPSSHSSVTSRDVASEPKKLSRFAQERRQERQGRL